MEGLRRRCHRIGCGGCDILGTLDSTTTGRVVGGIVMGVLVVTMRDTVGCSVALLIGIEPTITGAVVLFWEWGVTMMDTGRLVIRTGDGDARWLPVGVAVGIRVSPLLLVLVLLLPPHLPEPQYPPHTAAASIMIKAMTAGMTVPTRNIVYFWWVTFVVGASFEV